MKAHTGKQLLEDRLRTKCAAYTAATNAVLKRALLAEITTLCAQIYPAKKEAVASAGIKADATQSVSSH
jgi:hypothetical protein